MLSIALESRESVPCRLSPGALDGCAARGVLPSSDFSSTFFIDFMLKRPRRELEAGETLVRIDGLASAEYIDERLAEGFTVQLFQPQHYSDRLWALLAAMEAELGCLCGCSVYLTPPRCQPCTAIAGRCADRAIHALAKSHGRTAAHRCPP